VVQGALKLILEPIFEADFQSGSYGYRPKRTAHQAVNRVAQAIVEGKTRIIEIDLRAYFDNVILLMTFLGIPFFSYFLLPFLQPNGAWPGYKLDPSRVKMC
jgi:hypothetical protein